jgi:hypothetical protein
MDDDDAAVAALCSLVDDERELWTMATGVLLGMLLPTIPGGAPTLLASLQAWQRRVT